MQVQGKHGSTAPAPAPTAAPQSAPKRAASPAPAATVARVAVSAKGSSARAASLARRMALSSQGKRGMTKTDRQRTEHDRRQMREQVAEKTTCGCGGACCEQAKSVAKPVTAPVAARVAKQRPRLNQTQSGRLVSRARRSAMSARGKQGLEQHRQGTSSASLARQANPDISSRDLARVVREQRSQNGGKGTVTRPVGKKSRGRAGKDKPVTGTRVGHSPALTGDEAGLCHSGITGTQYLAADIFEAFCQDRSTPAYPAKVSQTETLRGSRVTTGGNVGSNSDRITGVEAGSCRQVTGSEYLGREHFVQHCDTPPQAGAAKVSQSHTQRGMVISGPKASRAEKVTGNEKGTCKAVTGTPYAGFEEQEQFCSPSQRSNILERQGTPGKAATARDITGIQPGLRGQRFTGTESGACAPVSGTPYLGGSELKAVCSSVPASSSDGDFPQPLGQIALEAATPAAAPVSTVRRNKVTGAGHEDNGAITGTFSLGRGKVTGTEQARFDQPHPALARSEAASGEETARVTGEGLDTGLRITGDDWNRGSRVTGTEGSSAVVRNPSRRGPTSAMPPVTAKRDPARERPSAPVTGGSGGSEGAAVTVSGGARG